jgi:hypothetical protein
LASQLLKLRPSEQILIHHQSDSAAQSRLVAFVSGPEPGNSYQWVSAHFGLDQGAYEMPERCNVTHDDDLAWRQSGRDHMHAATERGTHFIDRFSRRGVSRLD